MIVTNILPNILRNRDNLAIKFGQLTEYNMRKLIAWMEVKRGHVITKAISVPMSHSIAVHLSQVYCLEELVSQWIQCVMVWRTVLMSWMNWTAPTQAAQIIFSAVIVNAIFIRCGVFSNCNVRMVQMKLNAMTSHLEMV